MAEVVVLGTTETNSMEEATRRWLIQGHYPPHRVLCPQTGQVQSPVPWDTLSEREIIGQPLDRPGGVFWVDIVGWANRLPSEERWWEVLSTMLHQVARETFTDLAFPRLFLPFTDGQGAGPHRLTMDEWFDVSGFVGHQHLPNVQGGEPGDLSRLYRLFEVDVPLEESPVWRIHTALHEAGLWDGDLTAAMDSRAAEAVERLVADLQAARATITEQADQVTLLAEEVSRVEGVSTSKDEFRERILRVVEWDRFHGPGADL